MDAGMQLFLSLLPEEQKKAVQCLKAMEKDGLLEQGASLKYENLLCLEREQQASGIESTP